jgi:hypothetical protein
MLTVTPVVPHHYCEEIHAFIMSCIVRSIYAHEIISIFFEDFLLVCSLNHKYEGFFGQT